MWRPDPAFRRGLVGASSLVILAAVVTAPSASAASWQAVDTITGTGLGASVQTWEARPVDYNGDGRQDVWIGHHDRGGELWRNNGNGTYTRVALNGWPMVDPVSGKVPDRHDCEWADVDRDGRPDAYCSAGRGGTNSVKTGKDNELWLQRSPGAFTEVGTARGLGDVCGRSHYVAFLDANGDVYPDLFVANVPPRPVADPCDNPANGLTNELSKLYINKGGTGFTYRPDLGIGGNTGGRCAEVADVNGDGWDDLLTCGPGVQLYRNNRGSGFTDIAAANGLTSASDAQFGDLDRDGDLDLVTSRFTQFGYRLNTGGSFGPEIRIAAVAAGGGGRSVALGDADGDGDLDVYALVTNIPAATNPQDFIYRNDGLRFTPVPVPSAGGVGDAVTALDGNGDGRTEFLVLNGAGKAGASQRIELVFR